MGSRTAPVPVGVGRGFATARSLLADIDINDRGLNAIEEALESRRAPTGPENTTKASKPRREATKAKTVDARENVVKPKPKANPRGRKPKATGAEQPTGDVSTAGTATTISSRFMILPATDAAASTREHAAAALEPKPAKARKPRAKKATTDDSEIQTTIKRAKVTKPRATQAKKKAQKAAEVVSAHFRSRGTGDDATGIDQENATNGGNLDSRIDEASMWGVPLSPSRSKGPPKQRPPDPGLPLDLEEAVIRRRNWTPPPDSVRQELFTSSTGKENRPIREKESFTSMLSGYSYARLDDHSEASTTKPTSNEVIGAIKRRRVELVDLPVNHGASRQASPEKGKAPKKKPRTITDLVTGQYAPPQPQLDSPEVTSDFFTRRATMVTKTTKVQLNDTGDADSTKTSQKPVRKRSISKSASEKGETKGKSKKASAKTTAKPKLVAEKLLSPSSALVRLNRQEILFGTSSQLAREESPTMVRETQKAIRQSEQDADLRHSLASDDVPHIVPWSRLQRIEGRHALWRASSRDDNGQMLEKQSVCLPEPDRTLDFPLLPPGPHDKSDDSFLNINDFAPPPHVPIAISSDLPTPPSTVAQDTGRADVVSTIPSSPFKDINDFLGGQPTVANGSGVPTDDNATKSFSLRDTDDFSQDLPPSNRNVDSSFLDIDDFAPSAQASTRSFLSQVASTGSPKKPRGRPPKNQSAVPPRLPASAPVRAPKKAPVQAQTTTGTSPSTPRKNKSRFHSIEAILDSEDDEALSPTPPRTRRLEVPPPLPLVFDPVPTSKGTVADVADGLVPIYCIPEAKLTFDGIRPTLFPRITSLIRSLPPTSDPTKPSWHEKILMYDAIVAEDLASFLNTHSQIRTYKRATQKQSKAWNKDLKAKGEEEMKVAEGDGMVLAVEKEVESWMVQKWSEEMSVCCVSKERKNGGARKGLY
ncbi:5'-flap endonuclease [Didymosphaeria variabile]|uniref:Structure-specific endonuclease subunit SLX4 n=1 Tax=Didymosphaeria variabile TaxID=1932322 RepID=A0A9W8XIS1_9PLEO|nr:5'-flap endonuclease [Didymosphaeria variabile]KAJ4351889.1 5'-flap endonuclease [Didymosphaeria variabile]